jgi:hypothetical protein
MEAANILVALVTWDGVANAPTPPVPHTLHYPIVLRILWILEVCLAGFAALSLGMSRG